MNSDVKSVGEFSDIKPKIDINMVADAQMLKDHSLSKNDVSKISNSKLQSMDKYERLQYRFPFYLMDVNGFCMHVKEAMKIYLPDKVLL